MRNTCLLGDIIGMKNNWTRAMGDPAVFADEVAALTDRFLARVGAQENSLRLLREFVEQGVGGTSGDPEVMREMMGAFAVFINTFYGYRLKRTWWFGWKLIATNGRDRWDFFDMFYRMVFEGVNLAAEDEGLATPG